MASTLSHGLRCSLLLGAAPAMNHPSKDAIDSPRKIWFEIDSQILNALFCVTGFGLAPWRFRDLYWLIKAREGKNRYAMSRLYQQNKSWFRPPSWYTETEESGSDEKMTFTGEVAPPTSMWKLSFCVWMMVMNTVFQVVLATFMWAYNRIDRPSWATGLFIGLGCGVSLLSGGKAERSRRSRDLSSRSWRLRRSNPRAGCCTSMNEFDTQERI